MTEWPSEWTLRQLGDSLKPDSKPPLNNPAHEAIKFNASRNGARTENCAFGCRVNECFGSRLCSATLGIVGRQDDAQELGKRDWIWRLDVALSDPRSCYHPNLVNSSLGYVYQSVRPWGLVARFLCRTLVQVDNHMSVGFFDKVNISTDNVKFTSLCRERENPRVAVKVEHGIVVLNCPYNGRLGRHRLFSTSGDRETDEQYGRLIIQSISSE